MQAPRLLRAKRSADNARCVADDEGHFFGRAVHRRDEQVAFILPIVVVGHDYDLALREGVDRGFDALITVAHGSTSKATSRARLEWPWRSLADLATMHQIVVGEHARHHGLTDRHGANTDARIVTAFCHHLGVLAIAIHGLARGQNRGSRLDRKAGDDGLPGGDASEYAAGMIRQK